MKISELLDEAAGPKKPAPKQSRLPSAPRAASIDDEPQDDESSTDRGAIDALKAKMGSMGNDLFSISAYNYDDEFSSIGPNKTVRKLLDAIDDPAVSDYWQYDNMDITNDKIVSAVILNDRNGQFMTFYCGDGVTKIQPGDVRQLVRDGVIDSDQVGVLNRLMNSGKDYARVVGRTEWKAGTEARNSRVYDALGDVIDTLSLPGLPHDAPVISYHDTVAASDEEHEDMIQRILAKRREKEEKKNAGPGREKR